MMRCHPRETVDPTKTSAVSPTPGAIDYGAVVNPDTVIAQILSGIMFGATPVIGYDSAPTIAHYALDND
jgi:hypothetical protein